MVKPGRRSGAALRGICAPTAYFRSCKQSSYLLVACLTENRAPSSRTCVTSAQGTTNGEPRQNALRGFAAPEPWSDTPHIVRNMALRRAGGAYLACVGGAVHDP